MESVLERLSGFEMVKNKGGGRLRKDSIRDYATEAFRFYASCGGLTSEQLKEKVYEQIYQQSKKEFGNRGVIGFSDSTAYAVVKAEDAVAEMQAEFEDIIAVEQTLIQLRDWEKKAVEIVYFVESDRPLEKGDISSRVHKAEQEIFGSEKTIYRYLQKARVTFAKQRGLRTTKCKSKKFFLEKVTVVVPESVV